MRDGEPKMVIKSNERVFICGKTGTGKSYLAKRLIQSFNKYIIYDPDLEHSELGFVVNNISDFKKAISEKSKVVYQPKSYEQLEFIEVCEFIFNNLYNVVFMVDEIADLAPNNAIPSSFSMIIRRGSKRGIGCISITQRVAHVDKTPIAQSEHFMSFYQFLDNDIDKIKEFIGKDALKLRELKPYYFLYFSNNKIEFKDPIA